MWELAQRPLGESDKGLKTWKIRRETELLLSEERDQAEWGTLHFTGPSVSCKARRSRGNLAYKSLGSPP